MGFEIKDAASFGKWVEEQDQKFEQIKDLPSQFGQLAEQVKEVKETLAPLASRRVTSPDGKVVTPPMTKGEWVKAGLNAVLKSPTGVHRNAPGDYAAADDPFSKFQDACDKALIYATAKGWIRSDAPISASQLRSMPFYEDEYLPAMRAVEAITKEAFNTSDSGHASEWVPTEYSRRLWEKIRLEYRVAALFEEVPIPRSPFELPTFVGDLKAFRHVQNVGAIGGGTPLTDGQTGTQSGKITFTSETLGMIVGTSWEMDDDSIVAMMPFLERALVLGIRNGLENAIINGDGDGTHQDSDDNGTGATTATWAWDGLRKYMLAGTADISAANNNMTTDAFWSDYVGAARGSMGVYGVDGSRVAIITGPRTANRFRSIPRFATNYAFGELAQNRMPNQNAGGLTLDGMELVVSEFSREDVNASGVYDGVTTDRCSIVLVNKDVWKLGVQRQIRTKVVDQTYAAYLQSAVIATWRGDFQSAVATSANATGGAYNVAR